MKYLNCTVVFNKDKNRVLFCKRTKEPYRGLFNFVGGKVEQGEDHLAAAYRELWEETGITGEDIRLFHLMDITYYALDFMLEIYIGQLNRDVCLKEEVNPLSWIALDEDFTDPDKYAGDQNIAHIINMALKYPLERSVNEHGPIDERVYSVGIDGCTGGWIAAAVCHGKLKLYKFASVQEIADNLPFDTCLIDMIIGLQGNDRHLRPDSAARDILGPRRSTVFYSPCRKAVYAGTAEERQQENREVLKMGIGCQTDALIPKIRELDEFLQQNPGYFNRIQESHPEVCFARLKGAVLLTNKKKKEGIEERASVLRDYFGEITSDWIKEKARQLKCKGDDIADAVCLAIVANFLAQGKTETIPEKPMADDTGLLMQMVIPV